MAGVPDDDVEVVLDAIIAVAPQQKIIAGGIEELNRGRRQLNFSAVSTVAVSIVFLLLAMTFGESLMKTTSEGDFSGDWWDTPLQLRHTMDLPMDTLRAQLPVNGTYEALPYT